MWQSKYEKVYPGITKESIWRAWSDVASWPQWDSETELTSISGSFKVGTKFMLKPKGGPKISLQLIEVNPLSDFTDVTRFPFAKMFDTHAMEETAEGLKIISIIRVEGPLGWFWRKVVAEGVAAGAARQIESLAKFVKDQ